MRVIDAVVAGACLTLLMFSNSLPHTRPRPAPPSCRASAACCCCLFHSLRGHQPFPCPPHRDGTGLSIFWPTGPPTPYPPIVLDRSPLHPPPSRPPPPVPPVTEELRPLPSPPVRPLAPPPAPDRPPPKLTHGHLQSNGHPPLMIWNRCPLNPTDSDSSDLKGGLSVVVYRLSVRFASRI